MAGYQRILVVDDEVNVCRSCADMLAKKGWEVKSVYNGTECVKRIKEESFDAVILDLKIPDISGIDLLQLIKKQSPETPIIIITGYSTVSSAVEVLKLGAFDYLPKPFTPSEIRNAVERALTNKPAVTTRQGKQLISKEAVAKALSVPALKPRLAIKVKPEVCYGCLSCVVACAYKHLGLKENEPITRKVLSAACLSVEAAGKYSVPLLCMQCSDAPCMSVCLTGALHRLEQNGPISVDTERCIGCKSCILACPVGVLSLDVFGKAVQKCDMCLSRLQEGKKPVCVESCPMGALELVSIEDYVHSAAKSGARDVVDKLDRKE